MAAMASSPPSLLLLPAPPLPSSKPALSAAYRAPLSAVLARLRADLESTAPASSPSPSPSPSPSSSSSSATLVIAVACPVLRGPAPRRKTIRWRAAQALLAGIYTLVSAICAERAIPVDTDEGGGIDARVLLVDHAPRRRYEPGPAGEYERNRTVVYDLACFAAQVRPWRAVYHPSSEAGYELLAAYLALAEGRQALLQSQLVAVEGGLSLSVGGERGGTDTAGAGDPSGHRAVCLGGTFDHLHAGHKLLLHAAALLLSVPEERRDPQAVFIIGLSDDELLRKKKFAEELQPWATRADNVVAFLSTIFNCRAAPCGGREASGDGARAERRVTFRDGGVLVRLAVLRDPYGPTTAEEDVDALVLSGETRSGGRAINERRREKGWRPMEVYEIDVLDANGVMDDKGGDEDENADGGGGGGGGGGHAARDDFAAKISSTAIRQQIAERRAARGET